MDITTLIEGLTINDTFLSLAYVLGMRETRVCYLDHSSDQLSIYQAEPTLQLVPGQLYNLKNTWLPGNDTATCTFSDLTDDARDLYVRRPDFAFSASGYKLWILPSLLLGSRLRDYEQACATVICRSPLILCAPPRPSFVNKLTLRSESGELVKVIVKKVNREGDKVNRFFCTPISKLPPNVKKGSRLQFVSVNERTPLVTKALLNVYEGTRPFVDYGLLDRIYGMEGTAAHKPLSSELIKLEKKNGDVVLLNAEQTEAVWRYAESFDDCPAFAVESPPGTGKTLTAAAMAVSYPGPGLQLFLSTANVPVFNIALALADVACFDKKIIHLVSARREIAQQEHERSPFSLFRTDEEEDKQGKKRPRGVARFKKLGAALAKASKQQKLALHTRMCEAPADALAASTTQYDIILATVDMVLAKLLKKKSSRGPSCPIQKQLETRVKRIVVDEASQLTEAALNALIQCFPGAQIVLIGDSKQLPPFKYVKGEVISEMAACSALEVLKRRKNVPVTNMRTTYRQSELLMSHYSDVFYGGSLESGKPALKRVLLSSIFKSITMDCAFFCVEDSKSGRSGTSLINEGEIAALKYVVKKLRRAGYDHKSVMIIAYYEAQRKLAVSRLPTDYEVLTVDSAQGREKDIVIVLTTRDSKNASDFFTCPLRCNVAVSRHKEALIVLGHEALLEIEPWKQILTKKYFATVVNGTAQ